MSEANWFELQIMNLRIWFCKKFGHSFNPIEAIIFEIKTNAINRDMKATIKCRMCKKKFIHKDAQQL